MANNWNFNSGAVLNMLNSTLERNSAEERLQQQLAVESENYRKLREHQMAMQVNQQGWQSGEAGLTRGHQTEMQDAGFTFQRGESQLDRGLTREQNAAQRALQMRIAQAQSMMPLLDASNGGLLGNYDPFNPNAPLPMGAGGIPGIRADMANRDLVMGGTGLMRKPTPLFMAKPNFLGGVAEWGRENPEWYQSFRPMFDAAEFFGNREQTGLLNDARHKYNLRMKREGPLERWKRLNAPVGTGAVDIEEKLLMGQF